MVDTLDRVVGFDKKAAFDAWLEALRSGDFKQTKGTLCREDDNGEKNYCCIGVLNEVVFGTEWHALDWDTRMLSDDEGFITNLRSDHWKGRDLSLDQSITEWEASVMFNDYNVVVTAGKDTRMGALAGLNDAGVDFDTIAMLIEDTFEWSK